jgi:hypothetical protein
MRWLYRFVSEEGGFVTSPEWAFVATILVLGAITATLASRQADQREASPPPAAQAPLR